MTRDVGPPSEGVWFNVRARAAIPSGRSGRRSKRVAPVSRSTELRDPAARSMTASKHPSQRAQILEHPDWHGPVATEKKLGVPRSSFRDWRHTVARAAAGEATASPVSGPATDPKDERAKRTLEAGRWRPGLGPSQQEAALRAVEQAPVAAPEAGPSHGAAAARSLSTTASYCVTSRSW